MFSQGQLTEENTLLELLTVPEVATQLRVSVPRAYQLAREGVLPVVRLGRQVRIEEETLRKWVAQGGQGLPGGWRKEPGLTANP